MAETATRTQQLIKVLALGGVLLETLESLNDGIASEELIAALHDTCELAREELATARAAGD